MTHLSLYKTDGDLVPGEYLDTSCAFEAWEWVIPAVCRAVSCHLCDLEIIDFTVTLQGRPVAILEEVLSVDSPHSV